ncbi:hypothetical protein Tsubulata_014618 [Turnera subulata]|uniref:pectinesterase n=1 Tax=Turnera subulata TaxID=218843 RepID=A0A9Q0JQ04_9ROSI|nr:hypothetical protein Tsubulata_014618 [Turnera subulata]
MYVFHPILQFIMVILVFFCASKVHSRNIGLEDAQIAKTIVVDSKGQGAFTSVQKAIDSIPPNGQTWTLIKIKAGTYKEKVKIPIDKPFIALQGEGRASTVIQWGEGGGATTNGTLTVEPPNFVAADILFKNTYNTDFPKSVHQVQPAPAAVLYGDKASFYRCGFIGVQDTFTDAIGRHYLNSCYFEGGYITAQGRDTPKFNSGFVFLSSKIVGNGPAYLGRAYRPYSTVVFKDTVMPRMIQPQGWNIWNQKDEKLITYAEVNCTGYDKSKRVKWEKELSPQELDSLINVNNFINKDGWLEKQPKF